MQGVSDASVITVKSKTEGSTADAHRKAHRKTPGPRTRTGVSRGLPTAALFADTDGSGGPRRLSATRAAHDALTIMSEVLASGYLAARHSVSSQDERSRRGCWCLVNQLWPPSAFVPTEPYRVVGILCAHVGSNRLEVSTKSTWSRGVTLCQSAGTNAGSVVRRSRASINGPAQSSLRSARRADRRGQSGSSPSSRAASKAEAGGAVLPSRVATEGWSDAAGGSERREAELRIAEGARR
jgi:hypothetical protein